MQYIKDLYSNSRNKTPPSVRTQSLKGVCHSLVLGHIDESSSQAEMREDEEHLLQDPVHLIQMLERTNQQ